MKNIFVCTAVFLAMLMLPHRTGNAQLYKFQRYIYEDGLCYHTVNAIAQDRHGFIWFATGLGLCRYDGFSFSAPGEELTSGNALTAFRDSTGNLWFGYNDGRVVKYDGIHFSVADTSLGSTSINQIGQGPRGEILVATQSNGITRITDKHVEYLSKGFEHEFLYSARFIGKDRLLIGSQEGLSLYHYGDSLTFITKIDSIPETKISSIIPARRGGYWVATEDAGVFNISFSGDNFTVWELAGPNLEEALVQSIFEDSGNDLWISTFRSGLFRVSLSENRTVEKVLNHNYNNGLGSNDIKQILFDDQQNLWVATYGKGVSGLTNLAISFFEDIDAISNNATAVFSADNSEYWIGGMGAVVRITSGQERTATVFGRANGIPNDRITFLRQDENGNLWIGTEKNGLYKLARDAKDASLFYREENSLSNAIQAFIFQDSIILAASRNGVLVIDVKTGKKVDHFNTSSNFRLPHNNIYDIFKDSKGIIWIATSSNTLMSINSDKKFSVEDAGRLEFTSITEDKYGRLWAGTNGNGIYLFDESKDSIRHIGSANGLKSDYCYAMVYDGADYVGVGHRLGLSRINIHDLTVGTFGNESRIDGDVNPNALILNNSREILAGMTNGVMMYNLNADHSKDLTPMLNLSSVSIGDDAFPPDKVITLPYGKYKVQFDFIGLQYSNPESVTYQYMLYDYDQEWSAPTKSNFAIYPRLENGEYKFFVRARNNSNCTEDTMLFLIKIRKPFWKTWWFIFLCIVALVAAVYGIVAVRERNHRIQQEYLERELAERTKEVREQKEEIETKNRDITDSINYAQRIQFSVLPSTSTLLERCSEAFIFYRPRDIVSGDFYWFDYIPETKLLLIVCADSTGHGVPGAFMSLIGTTLIKDIAMRPDIASPADMLYKLDKNIQSTLNQNQDSEQANDGMDIVICEINVETQFVRVASAMRPFIVYHEGAPTTYKCNRSSIGGQLVETKTFDTIEIQLSPGDTIYMFTDGYADQFGGPSGKKFKMNRLQSILDDIYTRDMEEQCRVIKENFDLWKGPLPQVDDVLMIGVRL